MKVFCALITMTGQIRPHLLDPRQQIERVLVGHHHVGDDEIALALADPAPQRRRVSGQAHLISGARKSLVQNRADGGVVVGDKNATCGHCYSSSCCPVRQATAYPATSSRLL